MKKKNQSKSVIFRCLILFTLLVSCKKENTSDSIGYNLHFSTRALEYVKLTPGKYLIYKDSATSQLDSVVVSTSKLQTILIPEQTVNGILTPAHNKEYFTLELLKYNGVFFNQWMTGFAFTPFDYPFKSVNNSVVDLRPTLVGGSTIFYMADTDQPNLTMTVEGKIYNNVVVTVYESGPDTSAPYYTKDIYYWAKGVGLIKRTFIYEAQINTITLIRNN